MSRGMTVMVDAERVSVAETLRRVAAFSPLLVVKERALRDLAAELGGAEAAAAFLLELAEANNRPIAVNCETGIDRSSTAFIAPRHWSQERLTGWVGGRHVELEGAFGEITRIHPNRAARRRRQREGAR